MLIMQTKSNRSHRMPLLSPKCYELRFITFQSIQRLLSDGYPNEKEALHFVIKQSLKFHVLTGFDTDIDLAYN